MIIRSIDSLAGTEREIRADTWISKRLLLKKDGMGFSLHETIIHAGTDTSMCYRNHLEAVYCIEGSGWLTERDTGQTHRVEPGVMYALDKHDSHILNAETDLRLVCVFNPPCTGREVHDEDGAYPLVTEEASRSAT